MAYAYPSATGDAAASTSSLNLSGSGHHSSPQRQHAGLGVGGGAAGLGRNRSISRKGSDDKFDLVREFKLKIEEDESYISFFQDRIRCEEDYIIGLRRLYNRSKAIDSLHEDVFKREQKPTSRRAWDEVRDYTQREIHAREALVGALKEVVVQELLKLKPKEEQTRIRSGLKENMKLANEMYEEHAKNQLPKLKRAYWQKCQIVEDHKRQENAVAMQAKLLADSPTSPGTTPLKEHPNAMSVAGGPFAQVMSPPTHTAALPPSSNPALPESSSFTNLQHLHATSPPARESDKKHGRLRAGSASQGGDKTKEMFNDIAAQSKKGFNAIMQKLGGDKGDRDREEGGFVVIGQPQHNDDLAITTGLGQSGLQRRGTTARGDPSRGMGTMKGVKIKRDADEADKAYRLGIFHLESLRLRRDKLQTSGAQNLETFCDELNRTLVRSLETYVDSLHGTAATSAQATIVARDAIEAVNLDKDLSLYRTRLRAVESQRTAPVPYHNYYVGECRSLIFGVSLTDYDFTRGESSDHGRPPTIVEKCIAAIDEKGLDAEGIYRISGRHAGVQKMVQDIERDEEQFQFTENDDVFSISNILKQYLRELPDPVFPFPHSERVKYTENRETHIHSGFSALRGRLRRLAPIHQTTFHAIIKHLNRVAAQKSVNKMDAKNLAVVFNSVLFGQDQLGIDANLLTMSQEKDHLLEDIITYADQLFEADEAAQPGSMFPPGAALSRSGVISYHPVDDGPQPGSSKTRFKLLSPSTEPPSLPPRRGVHAEHLIDLNDEPEADSTDQHDLARPIGDHDASAPPQIPTPIFERNNPIMPIPEFTPDTDLELLFDPALIPSSFIEAVQADTTRQLHVRPLSSSDFMRSHFGLLQTLTEAPPMAPSTYGSLFKHLKACGGAYYIVVVVDKASDQLVAHGTLMIESKFIHQGGKSGHVEDIVVDPKIRGGGLGRKLIEGLKALAIERGCYKVVLHCKEDKVPFYEKCGFHPRSRAMAYYTPTPESDTKDLTSSFPPPPTHFDATLAPPIPDQGPLPTDHSDIEGSPRTIASASSGSGITYRYPIHPTQPPSMAQSQIAAIPESATIPPPLPPRHDTSPPVPVLAPVTVVSASRGDSLEASPHADPAPAWASEGLGDSEKLLTKASSLTTSDEQGHSSRSETPLPPGAAPPNLVDEPERIVQPRG